MTQALAESKPEERMLSDSAHGFLAVAEWLRGRLTEAERAFASSVTGWREIGQLTITAWGYYSLALLRRAQGRLDAAALTCEQALHSLVTSGRPLPATGPGYVGLAEIAYQRDELDSALRHATQGVALCRQFVYTTPLANGLATLAMIRQATGDPAVALEAITEAGQASPGPAGLLNPVPARHRRPADQPRAGGPETAGGGPVESGHRRRARGHPRHGQETCRPRPGQARRGQPHRGRRPGPRAEPAPLTSSLAGR
jgi:LuxR family maltose regulon positive regulatory protein